MTSAIRLVLNFVHPHKVYGRHWMARLTFATGLRMARNGKRRRELQTLAKLRWMPGRYRHSRD